MMLSIVQELGRLETFFSDIVYPVWPLWLALFVAAIIGAGYVAYRLGWHHVALQHRLLSGVALAAIVAVSVPVGWYTISPLFDRSTVCEASPIPGTGAGSEKCEDVALAATMPPTSSPTPAEAASPTPMPFAPRAVRQGEFMSADDFHFTYGNALLIETEPGTYTLRFEDFSLRNGPDVFVLLSLTNDYGDGAINLGSLKGTDGPFNYEVPPGTNISRYKSAIIWCRQFDVLFGHAELM